MEKFFGYFIEIAGGLGTTLWLFAATLVLSIPLGFLCSLAGRSRFVAARAVVRVYVLIFRGTPLLLQITFIYFGLGFAGLTIPRELAALLSLVINYTAYFSEIFRGGIQSVPKGQYEAAEVLGLTKKMTNRRIIMPQVIKIVFPSIGNETINLVKDTALVSTIAVIDLLKIASSAMTRSGVVTPLIVAAIFYLVINAVVTFGLNRIEKRLSYYR